MASVLNRTTKKYLPSANTPDYDPTDWIIDPDLSAVSGVPNKYWKLVGDTVSEMSTQEKADMDAYIAANTAVAEVKQVSVTTMPAPAPFATPTYRTKDDAIPEPITCSVNAPTIIDYQLTSPKSTYGGELIVSGSVLGDWVSAEVYDKDSVIPSGYRAATCEAWPSVQKYIPRRYINPEEGSLEIDTRPLIALIPAGLYLRVTYNAINSGGDRTVALNYFFVQKL
jgi:hypothetical protein